MKLPESLNVLTALLNTGTRDTVASSLKELGHSLLRNCTNAADLVTAALAHTPDLILTDLHLPDRDGVAALLDISQHRAIPAIIVTPDRSLSSIRRALEDHVMAYLIEPVSRDEVQPTVYLVCKRFEQFEELRQEVEDLKQALADRKVIEKAKGILMESQDLTEEEAYKQLRRSATDRRMRLADVAGEILGSQPDVSTASENAEA